MDSQFQSMDVVILCGGLGKRLRSLINDRPKPMAEVNARPFLDILMDYLARYRFKRVILALGYRKEMIKKYYQAKSGLLEIVYSEEETPLGTGGALKKAESQIKEARFLVMNGDSFCPLDFGAFIDFHLAKKALLSLSLTRVKQGENCGKVRLDDNQRIINFEEKADLKDKEYSNVGIYLMEKRIFSLMGQRDEFSLEYDFFPQLVSKQCYGYVTEKDLIDIGSPEEYRKAPEFFKNQQIIQN